MGFSTDVLGIRADTLCNCVLFSQPDMKLLFTARDHKGLLSPGLVERQGFYDEATRYLQDC